MISRIFISSFGLEAQSPRGFITRPCQHAFVIVCCTCTCTTTSIHHPLIQIHRPTFLHQLRRNRRCLCSGGGNHGGHFNRAALVVMILWKIKQILFVGTRGGGLMNKGLQCVSGPNPPSGLCRRPTKPIHGQLSILPCQLCNFRIGPEFGGTYIFEIIKGNPDTKDQNFFYII